MAFVDIMETEEDRPEVENVVVWHIPLEQCLVDLRIVMHYCLMLRGLSLVLFFLQSTSVLRLQKHKNYNNNRQLQTFRLISPPRKNSSSKSLYHRYYCY